MSNRQIVELRNRILGVLILNARNRVGATREACAQVLDVSPEQFGAYETGSQPISLPELELLGRFLDLPLHVFLEDEDADVEEEHDLPDPGLFLRLRHRLVGAKLRQARVETGRSVEQLAELLGRPVEVIAAYERGERAMPMAELEVVASALSRSLEHFVDQESEVGDWHQLQSDYEAFADLSPEMRTFVIRPINHSYLELAMKLAAMPAGALRQIAEGLLEITY
jgi:transcriptional regulator with XRE-family HTH domain